jgi:hypothetical protein
VLVGGAIKNFNFFLKNKNNDDTSKTLKKRYALFTNKRHLIKGNSLNTHLNILFKQQNCAYKSAVNLPRFLFHHQANIII